MLCDTIKEIKILRQKKMVYLGWGLLPLHILFEGYRSHMTETLLLSLLDQDDDFNYGENTQRYEHTFCLIACYELIVKHSANRRRHRRQIEIIITATRFSVTYINKLCTQCYRVYHLYHRPKNARSIFYLICYSILMIGFTLNAI